jgi:predicted phosphodiesterase
MGLNTINPARHQQGRVTRHQLESVEKWSHSLPEDDWKLVVCHQHIQNAPGTIRPGRIPNADEVVQRFGQAGVHGVLYGHTHVPFIGCTRKEFPAHSPPLLLINAATVTCRRTRGLTRANGFHLLDVAPEEIRVTSYEWPQTRQAHDFHPVRGATVFNRDRQLSTTA